MNIFEDEIKAYIKSKYNGTILENDINIISPYIANMYFPEKNFVIVYQSLLENSIGFNEYDKNLNTISNREYYRKQNKKILNICKSKNLKLFIIWENELVNNTTKEIWKSMILYKLGIVEKSYNARDCNIIVLDSSISTPFTFNNHIQSGTQSNVKLGLVDKKSNTLVSVLTMGKPRYNKNFGWEIIRFCSLRNTNCRGGANKLFKHFLKEYSNGENIITYANSRWSTIGGLYQTLGFEPKEDSQENYFYFDIDEKKLYPRIRFQKHKLKRVLETFKPSATEMENVLMLNKKLCSDNNGNPYYVGKYRQIYDAGNLKLELIQKK